MRLCRPESVKSSSFGVSSTDQTTLTIYDNQPTASFVQLGADLDGEAAGDQSGHPVSLDAVRYYRVQQNVRVAVPHHLLVMGHFDSTD